ncbi:MAG: HEAT repeat domain-containing protein, partial [Candidatus Omnitrophica bacterium]|nr:HEAT repeat domain-containing protein [Candidatus Omnitrophota bacterium]
LSRQDIKYVDLMEGNNRAVFEDEWINALIFNNGDGSRTPQLLRDNDLRQGHNQSGKISVSLLSLGALVAFMVSVALTHWTAICAFIVGIITVYLTPSLLGIMFLGCLKADSREGREGATPRRWFKGLRYWFSLFIIGISSFVNNGCVSVGARRMELYRSLKEVIAISNINEAGKEKGLEKYFLENCYLGDDIMLEPTEHLKMVGITQEDLYKCYQGLVRSSNFNVAFYAARCLAMLGDPAGSVVLSQGLKGGYNINDFFPEGAVYSGSDQDEIRNYVRMQAVFALARLKDSVAIGHLRYMLSEESNSISAVRVYAAYSLSIFDDREALEILIKYSADPDRSVRLECLRGLVAFNDPRLFDIFVGALRDKKIDAVDIVVSGLSVSGDKRAAAYLENIIQESRSPNTRSAALAALYRIEGDRVLNLAFAKARDNAEEVRMTAFSILSQLNGLGVREALISGLNDRSHLVRMTAALGFWGGKIDKTGVPDLIASLLKRERNSDVRLLYIGILGESNDNAAGEALRNIISDGDLKEAQAAIISAAFNANNKMMQHLTDLLGDRREEIRQVSVAALHTRIDDPVIFNKVFERMSDVSLRVASSAAVVLSTQINNHPELKDKLIGFMDRGDLETRLGILSGLSQAGSPFAAEFAKPYLNNQDLALRQMAAFSISQLAAHNTLPLLSPLVSDIDPSVRLSAIRGLAAINSPETVPLLIRALKDEQFAVRQSAIFGLAQRINDSPHLTFTVSHFLHDDNWQVRQAAVEALGRSTHPRVPEMLLPKMQDESVFVRQAAVANLARLDTPDVIKSMLPLLKDESAFVRRDTIVALGSKVCAHLELTEPIKEAATIDSDEIARRYANFALECGKNKDINHGPVKIRSMQILIPGFDDFFPFMTARNQYTDWSNKHPLKDMLERIGVTSRAFNWSGNAQDTFSSRSRVLDFFLENVRDAARMRVDIDMDWHSWGTPIGSAIFSGNPKATEAFRLAREAGIKINISCLGSPDILHRVSFLESKYKESVKIVNLWSPADGLSFPSIPVNLGAKGNMGIPEISHNDWFDYSMGNRFIRMKFPGLDMPQIHHMVKQSDPIGWIYRPRAGSWPGIYNFNSVAPLGHFRQAGNINISPALSEMQKFRAPNNYYLHQGLSVPQTLKVSAPRLVFQNNFRPLPSGQLNFNVYNNNRIIMPPPIRFTAPGLTVPKFAPITVPRSNFMNPGIAPRIPTYTQPIRYTPPPMRNLK